MSREPSNYRIEEDAGIRNLVVTGRWTLDAARLVEDGEVDRVTLNYALGFSEPDLDFLDAWPIRQLDILDRSLSDLEPVARLRETLEDLSVQTAPEAVLDLGDAPRLRALAGEWELIRWQVRLLDSLERIVTWRFDDTSLLALSDHKRLRRLTIKEPRKLESLLGAENFTSLEHLELTPTPWLTDITAIMHPEGLRSGRTGSHQLSYSKARLTAGLRCPGPQGPDSNRHLSAGQAVALPVELPRGRPRGVSTRRPQRKMADSARGRWPPARAFTGDARAVALWRREESGRIR